MIETQSSLMPKSLQWVRSPAAAMVINARLRRSDAAAAYTVIMANPRGLRGLELAGVTERRHEPVAGLPAVADNAPLSAGFEIRRLSRRGSWSALGRRGFAVTGRDLSGSKV